MTTISEITEKFKEFAQERASSTSNMPGSYVRAINKLNVILKHNTSLLHDNENLWTLNDYHRLHEILDSILIAQKSQDGDFFRYTPTSSYWRRRFYSSAIKMLIVFSLLQSRQELMLAKVSIATNAQDLANELSAIDLPNEPVYWDDDVPLNSMIGKERLSQIKVRENQYVFRKIVLKNYQNRCCITGLPIIETLRASHISEWATDPKNRLNPENGICLSATLDAAFDRHLISFDEGYRLIFSSNLHKYLSDTAFNEQFKCFEGKQMTMPLKFLPSQELLAVHRKIMQK